MELIFVVCLTIRISMSTELCPIPLSSLFIPCLIPVTVVVTGKYFAGALDQASLSASKFLTWGLSNMGPGSI